MFHKKVKSMSQCQTNSIQGNVSRKQILSCPVSVFGTVIVEAVGVSESGLQTARQQDRRLSFSQAPEPFWLACKDQNQCCSSNFTHILSQLIWAVKRTNSWVDFSCT